MRADVVGSITGVDATEWDRLARHSGVYQSHGWLRTLEAEDGVKCWYPTVRDAGGRLLGALPVHWSPNETIEAYRPDRLFAELPGSWRRPGIMVGTRRGYDNQLVLDPALEPDERRQIVTTLFDAMDDIRRAEGVAAAFFFYAPPETVRLLRSSLPGLVPVLTNMEARLTLPGQDFGDYLSLFPSRKAGVLREMREFEAAGYDVTIERLADTWPEVAPLRANVDRRHGHEWTDEQMAALLRRYAENLDDISGIYCCRLGGELVACSVFHEWGDTLYLRMVGFDYKRLRNAYEYFNLMFYRPIEFAYANGKRHLHFGIGSHRAKVLRKAHLSPLWTIRLDPAADDTGVQAFNEARLAQWRAEFAGFSWAFDTSEP